MDALSRFIDKLTGRDKDRILGINVAEDPRSYTGNLRTELIGPGSRIPNDIEPVTRRDNRVHIYLDAPAPEPPSKKADEFIASIKSFESGRPKARSGAKFQDADIDTWLKYVPPKEDPVPRSERISDDLINEIRYPKVNPDLKFREKKELVKLTSSKIHKAYEFDHDRFNYYIEDTDDFFTYNDSLFLARNGDFQNVGLRKVHMVTVADIIRFLKLDHSVTDVSLIAECIDASIDSRYSAAMKKTKEFLAYERSGLINDVVKNFDFRSKHTHREAKKKHLNSQKTPFKIINEFEEQYHPEISDATILRKNNARMAAFNAFI